MPAYQLSPACKNYIWGGDHRLREDFGIVSTLSHLAEAWVLSCHPEGPSILRTGPFAGLTLPKYIQRAGRQVLGSRCAQFEEFPLLIKLIDAQQATSIQVHPSDGYARKHERQSGKTEMWVILHAEPEAFLYYGLNRTVTREELASRIADGSVLEILRKVSVKAGDTFFIPAGTIHAIGPGLTIAEIQQNSDITYRVFDYGRLGADGKPRELHTEKALDVAILQPAEQQDFSPHLGQCRQFTVDRYSGEFYGLCGEESFHALLIIGGEGTLYCGGESCALHPGDSFFLPAGSGSYHVGGGCQMLVAYVT